MGEWYLVRRTSDSVGVAAFPDKYEAKGLAQEKEHELGAGFDVVPIDEPRPAEDSGEAFARLSSLKPPIGLEQIHAFTGFDPALHLTDDGRISPLWETSKIVRVDLPKPLAYLDGSQVTRVACHEQIVVPIGLALRAILTEGLWHVLEPYGGGFVPRFMRTATGPKWSTHAFGLAFDFDPARNALGAAPAATTFGGTPEGRRVVELFELHGFYWGGRFRRPDPMHYQFARGY